MKHYEDVKVPDLVKENCKKDKRGLYVPFIVLEEDGEYHFKINDTRKTNFCMHNSCCSICGTKIEDGFWFIAGPASTFHKNGSIADLPVHKTCGEYALEVCPYLAYARYNSKTDIDKLYKGLKDKTLKLVNLTVDHDRVPMFCFTKCDEFILAATQNGIVHRPKRPYLEIEFWNDGVKLSQKEGEDILKEHFKTKYSLDDLDYTFPEKAKFQWWGYKHVSGTYQAKRYFEPLDIQEAVESPFCEKVVGPFEASGRDEALLIVQKLTNHEAV